MKLKMRKEELLGKIKWVKTGKKKKKAIIACGLVVVLVAGGIYGFGKKNRRNAMAEEAQILSAQAETGSLSTTIEGTGTLANGDSSDIQIPTGITVKTVNVSVGDEVKEGDVLATTDSVAVSAELLATQEELDSINKQINDEADNDTTQYVTASVDGRVKKIYAKKNTDVGTTIIDKGALMLISMDGKMAVDLETSVSVTVGETVSVLLSDDTTVDGTVVKADDTSCTVTVTDNGTSYHEKVTVYNSSGKTVGSGKLYINKEAKVTAASGTVKKILVSENEKVSQGDSLLKLKGDFQTAEYLELETEKQQLEEKLESLLKIAQNNTITAEGDGIITAVNVTASEEAGSTTNSSSSSTGGSSTSSGATPVSTKSVSTSAESGLILTSYESGGSGVSTQAATQTTEENAQSSTKASEETTEEKKVDNTTAADSLTTFSSIENLGIAAPETGKNPVVSLTGTGYQGNVSWTPADTVFQADTAYSAKVTLTAEKGYAFESKPSVKVEGGTVSDVKVSGDGEGNTLTFTVSFEKTASKASSDTTQDNKDGQEQSTQAQNESKGSGSNGGSGSTPTGSGASISASGSGSAGSGSATGTASGSASAGTTTSSDSSSSSSTTENTEMTTAFSLASGKSMTLSVNVDELDILSVSVGQKAEITLDAIEDQQFEGEITGIDKSGTSNGGVTKYAVEITVSKDDSMLAGMNASASIIVSEAENVLLIPAQAVTEEGNTSYVYTEKDDSSGELSGKTEVETGATDGNQIEITSGLTEGTTVYYQAMGTSSSDSENSAMDFMQGNDMKGGFDSQGGGGNPGGGEAPSGGNGGAPSGGMGGGKQ